MTSSMLRSSRFSMTVATGRRVPLNTQAPLTLPGTLSTIGHCDQSSAAISRPPSFQITADCLGRHSGSRQLRSPSSRRSHSPIRFQLANVRLTTLDLFCLNVPLDCRNEDISGKQVQEEVDPGFIAAERTRRG